MSKKLRLVAVAGGALVALTLQSPTPRHGSLEQARHVYESARGDELLAQRAAAQLARARQTLRQAERAWAARSDEASTEALALLALRQVAEARSVAAPRLDDGGGEQPALHESVQHEAALLDVGPREPLALDAGRREPASQRNGSVRTSVIGATLLPQSSR